MLTCARYINYKVAQVSRSAEETRVYVAKSIRLSETLHWSGLTSIHSLHFRSITHRSCIFSRRPWSNFEGFLGRNCCFLAFPQQVSQFIRFFLLAVMSSKSFKDIGAEAQADWRWIPKHFLAFPALKI